MSRKDLTSVEKISILDKIKAQPHSLRELEKLIGTFKSVLNRLKNNEKTIREQWEKLNDSNSAPANRKRKRESKDPEVDRAMNEWFSAVTERGVRISGPMLQQKAEIFVEKIGHGNFKATEGWMSRWKDRNNIKFKRFHGEKSSADSNGADEWSLAKLPEILKKIC
ncbi:Homeobox domain-like,HTH CenpB-type DNA-binding domain [Cinara cedri]|uniref:Homeobox domain-like,HTH CenpB-type DNA-binding domain n=1 Tax=Cinara cedri TaxID=506608 RepID=A0A5E4MIT9_9HEMI|nr:Homeobox domain-like,HTH CenpB-type DNA-binding domain [Cinara cedri]